MGGFYVIVIAIGYGLEFLDPPPSLRDTSASGGHEKVIFAIVTQSLRKKSCSAYVNDIELTLVKFH